MFQVQDLRSLCQYVFEEEARTQRADTIQKKPKDLSEAICFRCKEAGHYATKCPNKMKARAE